jgi:hypothetical protein
VASDCIALFASCRLRVAGYRLQVTGCEAKYIRVFQGERLCDKVLRIEDIISKRVRRGLGDRGINRAPYP